MFYKHSKKYFHPKNTRVVSEHIKTMYSPTKRSYSGFPNEYFMATLTFLLGTSHHFFIPINTVDHA